MSSSGVQVIGGNVHVRKSTSSSSSKKRKATDAPVKETLVVMPLGAGNEVGRSSIIIKYKGKTIMLDCGIHPAYHGVNALPFIDWVPPSEVDLLLISHFHLDHAAALPYYLAKTDFRGRVFMTHPTKSIYNLMLQDYVKVSMAANAGGSLYDLNDLKASMDRIETINYHETKHVNGIKFWAYNAGHVLGAAMFFLEIANVKILYTGDYSRCDDRHLTGAETPEMSPDILIVESTYGTQVLKPIADRERRFTELVHNIVKGGGRCLIPVFALGRAQELLLILEEYWEKHTSLQSIPIYYASALAKKCMAVYRTYVNMMNSKIQDAFEKGNPFDFTHIRYLKGMEDFMDLGPSVVFASPGMLQNGFSRQLFEMWCTEKKNGVIIPGYSVEGTLAKTIMMEPKDIEKLNGEHVPLKMKVHYIPFSAHADFKQTAGFVDELKPPHVILVHGDSQQMSMLNKALVKKYKGQKIGISTPKNCQPVELQFRLEKIAKTVGMLAVKPPQEGDHVSGIVVQKDYSMQIMDARDLATFTPLAPATINQTLKVPFKHSIDTLQMVLSEVFDLSEVKEVRKKHPKDPDADIVKHKLKVYESVSVTLSTDDKLVDLEWVSNPVHDMVADSIIALMLSIESKGTTGMAKAMESSRAHNVRASAVFRNPLTAKSKTSSSEEKESKSAAATVAHEPQEALLELLTDRYGSTLSFDATTNKFSITLPHTTALVDNASLEVECDDKRTTANIQFVLRCARSVLAPVHTESQAERTLESARRKRLHIEEIDSSMHDEDGGDGKSKKDDASSGDQGVKVKKEKIIKMES